MLATLAILQRLLGDYEKIIYGIKPFIYGFRNYFSLLKSTLYILSDSPFGEWFFVVVVVVVVLLKALNKSHVKHYFVYTLL